MTVKTLKNGFELASEPVLDEFTDVRLGFNIGVYERVVFKHLYILMRLKVA